MDRKITFLLLFLGMSNASAVPLTYMFDYQPFDNNVSGMGMFSFDSSVLDDGEASLDELTSYNTVFQEGDVITEFVLDNLITFHFFIDELEVKSLVRSNDPIESELSISSGGGAFQFVWSRIELGESIERFGNFDVFQISVPESQSSLLLVFALIILVSNIASRQVATGHHTG